MALVLLGALLLAQSFQIGQTKGYSPVGPTYFAVTVSFGLIALGGAFLLSLLRPTEEYARMVAREEEATHWPTTALVAAALVVYPFLLGTLGYILATALFFPLGARVLGSSRLIRDALIGLAVGAVIWFGFTQLLGVHLPGGLLDPVLPGA